LRRWPATLLDAILERLADGSAPELDRMEEAHRHEREPPGRAHGRGRRIRQP
jgi:hypothetical protein